jgi:deoxyribodipyrimidine photo-lyase
VIAERNGRPVLAVKAGAARQLAGGEESLQAIRVWEQELAWREFYQQALFHFPELADGPYRPLWRQFPWENNPVNFQAWRDGLTGIPIVDAAMRQLNTSGWMHNRCRMIVASFLVKDLICDWRWGERAFMQRLVDGDLAANNGGWQWSASSGMDPKPLRIFNPGTQAKKFDPQAEYIRHWLPELARVSSADLISGGLGNDSLVGGAGSDILIADPTDARIDGGADVELVVLASYSSPNRW